MTFVEKIIKFVQQNKFLQNLTLRITLNKNKSEFHFKMNKFNNIYVLLIENLV